MAITLALVLAASTCAMAHTYVTYMPVGAAPVVGYYGPAPMVAYGPMVRTAYYAPPAYVAPAPYYVASPVQATAYYAPPAVMPAPMAVGPVYGRPVIVHPKVYVPGQPVRNVLRAVTP
jgi:hypothetical protein